MCLQEGARACSLGCPRRKCAVGSWRRHSQARCCTLFPDGSSTISPPPPLPCLSCFLTREDKCELRSAPLLGLGPESGHMRSTNRCRRLVGARICSTGQNSRVAAHPARQQKRCRKRKEKGKEIHPGQSKRQRRVASCSSPPVPASNAASAWLTCHQGWRLSRVPLCCVVNCGERKLQRELERSLRTKDKASRKPGAAPRSWGGASPANIPHFRR